MHINARAKLQVLGSSLDTDLFVKWDIACYSISKCLGDRGGRGRGGDGLRNWWPDFKSGSHNLCGVRGGFGQGWGWPFIQD